MLGLAFSLALHASAAAALLTVWTTNDLGVVQVQTEAISFELAPSDVSEQADAPPLAIDSGAQSAVAVTAGREIESVAASRDPASEIRETKPALPTPTVANLDPELVKPDVEQVVAGPAEVELQSAQPVESAEPLKEGPEKPVERAEKKPRPPRDKAERRERETAKTSRENSTKGGVTSKASAAAKSGSGRVSASTGDILGYAALLRARVASNKPSSGGHQGTAVVTFGVSSSGGVTYVRLRNSSGNAALDQAALAAVRRAAPFPPPPAGSSSRAFVVPIHFR